MNKQREKNWNQRYLNSDIPWEDSEPKYSLKDTFSQYCHEGARVLEVGCGLGTNAYFLAEQGYKVTAIDISEKAIDLASKKFVHGNLKFLCNDFTNPEFKGLFDAVFDKGCLHSFTQQESYNKFAETVSRVLVAEGVWINISGNADNPDDLEKRKLDGYPRMSLTDIAIAVEPFFEIQEIKKSSYGKEVKFLAWSGVFKKRNFFYRENWRLKKA
ncbi:MAG: class I SAM-dependent methyltransferase [Candidatus Rifleibacteriota bacterium]